MPPRRRLPQQERDLVDLVTGRKRTVLDPRSPGEEAFVDGFEGAEIA